MLNLIKLCVGAASVDDLVRWRADRQARGLGRSDGLNVHRTRMMPRRADEIVGQGSLYWVMSGHIRCRQKIVALDAAADRDGRKCCDILMDPEVILTVPQPKRPFQGWRYLDAGDAPQDIDAGKSEGDAELAEELARLGLL